VSALRARAVEYLAMRRALGFKLETQGPRLMSFVRFCEEHGTEHVTTNAAPISVRQVVARIAGVRPFAALISAATSSGE
jgi:hypothetical protein